MGTTPRGVVREFLAQVECYKYLILLIYNESVSGLKSCDWKRSCRFDSGLGHRSIKDLRVYRKSLFIYAPGRAHSLGDERSLAPRSEEGILASRQLNCPIRLSSTSVGRESLVGCQINRRLVSKRLYEAQDEVESRKEDLLSRVKTQLKHKSSLETLFVIRWRVKLNRIFIRA